MRSEFTPGDWVTGYGSGFFRVERLIRYFYDESDMGGVLGTHPLQRRPASRAYGGDGGAPGASTEYDDFGFALSRCHGGKRIADACHFTGS